MCLLTPPKPEVILFFYIFFILFPFSFFQLPQPYNRLVSIVSIMYQWIYCYFGYFYFSCGAFAIF
eukprot:UN01025